jgi:phosphoglycolate phosphatase
LFLGFWVPEMLASPLTGAAILFDLDGTLVDTAPDLAGTMNDILAKLALPPLALATVRHLVGHGARALIEHGLKTHERAANAGEVDLMLQAFFDIYAARIANESRAFPGAQVTLDLLTARGCVLGVVTNKPEDLTRLLLDALGLANRFGALIGRDTAARPKPHPDPILLAAERLKTPIGRTLMIGDSETDVAAARAAGVQVIVVRHGYSTLPVEELGADAIIDGFSELIAAAERLLGEAAAA